MKRHFCMLLGRICYGAGIIGSIYYGLWRLLVLPFCALVGAVMAGTWTFHFIAACLIKILVSTTITGLIWCIGYIGYNYFKGTEDPDWDAIMQSRMGEDQKERQSL